MRERSETIYADNKTEYIEMMSQIDKRKEIRRKRQSQRLNVNENINCPYNLEFEDSFKSYKMSVIEPTIEEKQRHDESELIKTIENMNKNFRIFRDQNLGKNKENTNDEYQGLSGTKLVCGYNYIEAPENNNENNINSQFYNSEFAEENYNRFFNYQNISPMISKNSTEPNTLCNSDMSNMEAFMSQNLINFQDILKLIVIGDKSVGKTLFVNRFVNDFDTSTETSELLKYNPTESLEIKKTFLMLGDNNLKIELWDTNISVLNSPIVKTYYKISNGFILVADYDRAETLSFIEKHIETIFNISNFHNNIILIVNKKESSHSVNPLVENKLKNILEKFNINVLKIDMSKIIKKDNYIRNFIHKVLIKKIGERKISSSKKKSKVVASKSPKKVQRSNNSSNKTSPLNLQQDSQYMNFTLKRTQNVKRNLSEIFHKLALVEGEDN